MDGWMLFGCKNKPSIFYWEHATIPAVHKFYPILRQVQLV